MQHKGGPRLLLTDREGALYLERARVDVEGDRVVYHITDDEMQRHFNIPMSIWRCCFWGRAPRFRSLRCGFWRRRACMSR